MEFESKQVITLSIVIPCFNESQTLARCVDRVRAIADDSLGLELIIVDDASTDDSVAVAESLVEKYSDVRLFRHVQNRGKGAALRTGFKEATGDFVAVQDADLEYNPQDFKKLLPPLIAGEAEVVFGSRFLPTGANRVLYFWHMLGNRFLTFLSNMFTDLNLTDMETGYKVFRRDIIQSLPIRENRFGFEPEIVARVAHLRVRIFEIGITYHGRTYDEGKKIGVKDGIRALYCILRYNIHCAPLPIQLVMYGFFGISAALINLGVFLYLYYHYWAVSFAAPIAFVVAAVFNYLFCVGIIFRHQAKWKSIAEIVVFLFVVAVVGVCDFFVTQSGLGCEWHPAIAKLVATFVCAGLNFVGRRYLVFPEPSSGPWRPSETK